MSRILEYQPVEEEVIVSRILVQIHQKVDMEFPNAAPASKRFAKTIINFADNEHTKGSSSPLDQEIEIPPPPVARNVGKMSEKQAHQSRRNKNRSEDTFDVSSGKNNYYMKSTYPPAVPTLSNHSNSKEYKIGSSFPLRILILLTFFLAIICLILYYLLK
ncbi:MAG: hypothetical protein HQK54_01725 [Oligoflexales bacterium]|nr:hypothetical protein [Oligoflexales bacterium]